MTHAANFRVWSTEIGGVEHAADLDSAIALARALEAQGVSVRMQAIDENGAVEIDRAVWMQDQKQPGA